MNVYLDLFFTFSRAGLLAFGGGPSMIPLIQREVVGHGWLTDAEFVDALAMGNALPGPIATKMSGYTGYKVAGIPGAVVATSGMAFPTVVLMLVLAALYFRYRETQAVKAMLSGVRPAVVALLAVVVIEVWPESMRGAGSLVLGAIVFLAVLLLHVHPAVAIVVSAIVGLVVYR